jgi:hypothetical protein
MRVVVLAGAIGALAMGLAACGGHPAAVPNNGGSAQNGQGGGAVAVAGGGESGGGNVASQGPGDGGGGMALANAPVRKVNGRPVWAANRRHGAEDNAQYQFGKNGRDFAAATEDDYIAKVHAFVANPPAGAETINRKNGDRLIYDPRTNTFAVVTKDGAPRTMFKPRDGAAYWAQQKTREADRSRGGDSNDG